MARDNVTANAAWESVLTAHAALTRSFAAERVWQDLSMREYDVLYTLSKCPAPTRISDLNDHVLLSQPGLSRLVHRLAGRGLVECRPDPADGRGVLVSLTPAGRERQRQIGRRHARSVARTLTASLDHTELSQLTSLCQKLHS
jgi:DNA-binding MarR family transcriptional regulator